MKSPSELCAHCGADDVGTFEAGFAGVGDDYLCHPNAPGRSDCYRLVTVYKHPMPCVPCRRARRTPTT